MVSQASTADGLRVVRCGIGTESYALAMDQVHTIRRADRLRRPGAADPPGARAGCVGYLPARGGDVPVFLPDGRPARPGTSDGGSPYVVVLRAGPRPWGLLADRVSQVLRVQAEHVHAVPPLLRSSSGVLFRGVVRVDQELLLLLDAGEPRPAGRTARDGTGAVLPPGGAAPVPPRTGRAARPGRIVLFTTADRRPGERGLTFGLGISQVREVVGLPALTRVPQVASFVAGLAPWRDRPVPVLDLACRLGLAPSTPDGQSRLLIVPAGADAWAGIVVRPSVRVLRLPLPHRPCRRVPPVDQALVRGVMELKGETLVIPNLRRVLDVNA